MSVFYYYITDTVLSSTFLVDRVGLFMFAIYQIVVIIVLVNILIAMMSHSFEDVQVSYTLCSFFGSDNFYILLMHQENLFHLIEAVEVIQIVPRPELCFWLWRDQSTTKNAQFIHFGYVPFSDSYEMSIVVCFCCVCYTTYLSRYNDL